MAAGTSLPALPPRLLLLLLLATPSRSLADASPSVLLDADAGAACEDVGRAADQCAHVQAHCAMDSRVDYLSAYYCGFAPRGAFLVAVFWVLLVAVSTVLFLLLGDTADKYFSPTLTQICQQVPKMRPRFAGVTLLAFANGAPDLSATVNAIKSCNFYMSLGALTGAGMFVNCFVAGWIILVAGGARCRGATIRDVTTYFVTVAAVLLALLVGRVGYVATATAFVLYGAFVAVVFASDEWHEKGRPRFWEAPLRSIGAALNRSKAEDAGQPLMMEEAPVWAAVGQIEDGTELGRVDGRPQVPAQASPRMPAVWAALSPSMYRQQALAELAEFDPYFLPVGEDDGTEEGSPEERPHPLGRISPSQDPWGGDVDGVGGEGGQFSTFEVEQGSEVAGELGAVRDCPWVVPAWEEMIVDDWRELSTVEKLLLAIRLPLVLAQRATIPMTSQENYSRTWLVVSVLFAPFFALLYFETQATWPLLLSVLAGPLLSALVMRSTQGLNTPPKWSLGTSWPIGTAVIALYGLAIGVFWIDLLAGELVGLLRCAGIITGIPEAILGLTVLAWGNSVGDFFTNTSIAKAGKGNMAITACYAGPVFNMLVGLGLGFLSFFAKNHTHVAHVVPQRDVVLGCVFLLVHAMVVVGVGLMKGLRLPRWFGYFSIGWYGLYLALAVAMGVTLGPAAASAGDQC